MTKKKLIIEEAKEIDVEKLYAVSIRIDGKPYVLLVGTHTEGNGIECMTGQDILGAIDNSIDYHRMVADLFGKNDHK